MKFTGNIRKTLFARIDINLTVPAEKNYKIIKEITAAKLTQSIQSN